MVRRLFLMPEDGPSPQGGEARIPGEDDRDYREPERKPTHSPAESTPRRRTFFSFAGDTDNSADEIVQRVVRETGAIDNAEEPLRSEEEPEIESFRRLRFSLLDEEVPEETVPEDDSGPVDELNEIDGDREPEEDLEIAEAFEPDEEVEQIAAEVESVEEDDMAAEADETDDDLSSHDPLRVPIDEYDPELWDKMDHDMSADHTPDEVAEDVDGELDSSDTPEPENSDEEVDQNLEIAFEHDESVIHDIARSELGSLVQIISDDDTEPAVEKAPVAATPAGKDSGAGKDVDSAVTRTEKKTKEPEETAMKDRKDKSVGGNLRIEFSDEQRARLKVVGVGGAGSNAVDNMIASHLEGVDFIAVNTDAQALFHENCLAPTKVQIGKELTRGLGAGGDPEIGRQSAEQDIDKLRDLFTGADMVFVAAGMGGGTGSGAAPVIAQMAREKGILTIGIVTKPFMFEGRKRLQRAQMAIEEMKDSVDTLIVIPNDKVFDLFKDDLPYHEAFRQVDQVLYMGTKGISDIINTRGFINVDFADAKSVMSSSGDAIMGIGVAEGEDRAAAAAASAIDSPLLDNLRIDGARGILINITGSKSVGMKEVQEAVNVVTENAQEDADIYFGLVEDDSMGDHISVTVIATGFSAEERRIKMNTHPDARYRQHDSHRKSLMSVDSQNGTNDTQNGHRERTENGDLNGTRNGKHLAEPKFKRVEADPEQVGETLADRANINRNDMDVPAFLRRHYRNGKS